MKKRYVLAIGLAIGLNASIGVAQAIPILDNGEYEGNFANMALWGDNDVKVGISSFKFEDNSIARFIFKIENRDDDNTFLKIHHLSSYSFFRHHEEFKGWQHHHHYKYIHGGDDVTTVPTPTTAVLMFPGLALLGVTAWRKKKIVDS